MIDITVLQIAPQDDHSAYTYARTAQILTMAPVRDVYTMLCECIEHQATPSIHSGCDRLFLAGTLAG